MPFASRNWWSGIRTSSPSTMKSKGCAWWSGSAAERSDRFRKGKFRVTPRSGLGCVCRAHQRGGGCWRSRRGPCGRARRGQRWRWAARGAEAADSWRSARAPGATCRRPWRRRRRRTGGGRTAAGRVWGGFWDLKGGLVWLGFLEFAGPKCSDGNSEETREASQLFAGNPCRYRLIAFPPRLTYIVLGLLAQCRLRRTQRDVGPAHWPITSWDL